MEYVGENYPKYFATPHWQKLKQQLIYTNPTAKCWICGKLNSLLIHHEKYDNLFAEQLGKDVWLLCFDCHKQLHFYKLWFFFTRKTKLDYKSLKRKRYLLKTKYCTRNKQFGLSLWYSLNYLILS